MTPSQFTPETLQAAWQACKRPAWPAEFESCMADPLISRMIMLYALHGRREKSPQQFQWRKPQASNSAVRFDRKRLASGEREDD